MHKLMEAIRLCNSSVVCVPMRGALPGIDSLAWASMGVRVGRSGRAWGERTISRRAIDLRVRSAVLRPYGAGGFPERFHRAYAVGYFLAPLTGLGIVQAQG